MTNFVNKRTQLRPRYSMREKIFNRKGRASLILESARNENKK